MRIITVIRCRDCPYYAPNMNVTGSTGGFCLARKINNVKVIQAIEDPMNIPEYCPLEENDTVTP